MENLNDVEFGSDKDSEEAPIFTAQRYLNIFRQIHIFSKEKRDQFDDELLALPANVFDFFKRMPGGRLLVEHVEEVKSERGIAFVKSKREDFDEGAGKTETPSPVVSNGAGAGGTLVLDANFAETLANSMASAFKQIPTPVSTSVQSGGTIDLGNSFDVIAEEIRVSRASLLDVLKETRSVTDSVIASQVTISRILESLLSSRTRDDLDVTNLNNRIIASQASITKLLENIYTSHNKRDSEISNYLDVDKKLYDFRKDIELRIDGTMAKMQDMLADYAKVINKQKITVEAINAHTSRPQDESFPSNKARNISEYSDTSDINHKIAEEIKENISLTNDIATENVERFSNKTGSAQTISKSKKKHKDRNSQNKQSSNFVSHNDTQNIHTDKKNHQNLKQNNVDLQINTNKKIENQHPNKNFSKSVNNEHIHKQSDKNSETENVLPSNSSNTSVKDLSAHAKQTVISDIANKLSDKFSTIKSNDKNTSDDHVIDGIIRNSQYKHNDSFENVNLDIPTLNDEIVPNTSNVKQESEADILNDGLDYVLPENMQTESNTVENKVDLSPLASVNDDGLDFSLPEHNLNTELSDSHTSDISTLDELNFVLPEDIQTEHHDIDSNEEDLDFGVSQSEADDFSLDSLTTNDSDDIVLDDSEKLPEPGSFNLDNLADINLDGNPSISQDNNFNGSKESGIVSADNNISELSQDTVSPLENLAISESDDILLNKDEKLPEPGSFNLDDLADINLDGNPSISQDNNFNGSKESGIISADNNISELSQDTVSPLENLPISESDDILLNKDENLPESDSFNLDDLEDIDLDADPSINQDNNFEESKEPGIVSADISELSHDTVSSLDSLSSDETSNILLDEHENLPESDRFNLDDLADIDLDDNATISQGDNVSKVKESNEISLDQNSFAELPSQTASESDISLDDLLTNNETSTNNLENPVDDINISESDTVPLDEISEENNIPDETPHEEPGIYSKEIEKIRQALTADDMDISSLEEPIALDDYNDDENVSEDDSDSISYENNNQDWEWEYVDENGKNIPTDTQNKNSESNDDDWEWEYVDENGNPVSQNDDNQDWEWEYVDDEGSSNNSNNAANIKSDNSTNS